MKKCSICGQVKEDEDFPLKSQSKASRRSSCKACVLEYQKGHYKKSAYRRQIINKCNEAIRIRNKTWVLEYLKKNPCVDCGETDPIVLEFDHRDSSLKTRSIAQMVTIGNSIEKIKAEIEKCDVRCANCHRRKTAVQLGWFRGGIV